MRTSFHRIAFLAVLTVVPMAWAETGSAGAAADDGLDVSEFLDKAYGFIPYAAPITEPAVGYGGTGGLLFVDKEKDNPRPGFGRPNLTAVGGMGTENGTWGGYAVDSRYWMNDQLQTLAGAIYASVNLDFHGIGEDNALKDHPLRYKLEPKGGALHVKDRLGDSGFMYGIGYAFSSTAVTFDDPAPSVDAPLNGQESNVGGTTLSATYDTRDNLFTPRTGSFADISGGLFSPLLGADDSFQRAGATLIQYLRMGKDWTFGINAGGTTSFGDIPFYMLPYITLRGVPAMRYQGETAAQAEAEVRWQFWKRWSLIAFAGAGSAWNNFDHVDNQGSTVAGGGGFRYEIARKYGLHMGIDAAASPDGAAVYLQLGSAWMRP